MTPSIYLHQEQNELSFLQTLGTLFISCDLMKAILTCAEHSAKYFDFHSHMISNVANLCVVKHFYVFFRNVYSVPPPIFDYLFSVIEFYKLFLYI